MSQPLITAVIPWWGGHPAPLQRTIESVKGIADEALVVHQCLFDGDVEIARSLADKVEVLDWNAVFHLGFGELANKHSQASGKWMLLLGTGETIAEEYQQPIRERLKQADLRKTYRCNHRNDVNDWHRIWCPAGGVSYGGLIHESVVNHTPGPVIFRMQDTPKEPHQDEFHNQCLHWMKTCAYNHNYRRIGQLSNWLDGHEVTFPELSGTDRGWLTFVRGSREAIEAFCLEHDDLIAPALKGDREAFYGAVWARMAGNVLAKGVNFEPTGEKTSGNETITLP